MATRQDLPPKGGYEDISFQRIIHKARFPGWAVITGSIAAMTVGWVIAIQSNKQKVREKKEVLYGQHHLLPLLQAEEDRKILRSMLAYQEEEAQIMKDVPGWVVGESVYHTDKWRRPPYVQLKDPPKNYMKANDD